MKGSNRLGLVVGLAMGITLAAIGNNLLAQTGDQPVKSEMQYSVTGEGDDAHLWVHEGTGLRCVGQPFAPSKGSVVKNSWEPVTKE